MVDALVYFTDKNIIPEFFGYIKANLLSDNSMHIPVLALLFVVTVALPIAGCSSYAPALHEEPTGKIVVYEMPLERAQRIVYTVMSSHFSGRDVTTLPAPAIGYTTYTRMMIDTWTTTVTITPVVTKENNRTFNALKIETKGAGSSILTGRLIYEGFKDRLRIELDNTGSIKVVDSYSIL